MKGALGLAGEFLDRLANPVHGVDHNEAHAARFHELIERDPELRAALLRSDLDAGDVDLLSTTGWLWYLTWRRSEGASLPAEEFVEALFRSTGDLVVRLRIVDLAASDPALIRAVSEARPNLALEATPPSWLRSRLLGLVPAAAPDDAAVQAQQMALLLLQVGTDVARIYLRALLAERSRFRDALRESVTSAVVYSTGGDEEAVSQWRRDLGI